MIDKLPFAGNAPLKKQKKSMSHDQGRFGNVQLIYELILVQLELRSLGVVFEMADGFSSFGLLAVEDDELVKRQLAYFQTIRREETDYVYISRKNRRRDPPLRNGSSAHLRNYTHLYICSIRPCTLNCSPPTYR